MSFKQRSMLLPADHVNDTGKILLSNSKPQKLWICTLKPYTMDNGVKVVIS